VPVPYNQRLIDRLKAEIEKGGFEDEELAVLNQKVEELEDAFKEAEKAMDINREGKPLLKNWRCIPEKTDDSRCVLVFEARFDGKRYGETKKYTVNDLFYDYVIKRNLREVIISYEEDGGVMIQVLEAVLFEVDETETIKIK